MPANSLLFVHAPLVGPSSFERMARTSERAGWNVALPDLTGIWNSDDLRWDAYIDAAAAATTNLDDEIVVLGHSGAGVFLPAIGDAVGERLSSLVFIDAVVPPVSGVHQTPEEMKSLLDEQTTDGRLKKWIEWWPDEIVEQILRDGDDKAMLSADMPELHRELFEQNVEMPSDWSKFQSSYLKLSAAYDDDLREAVRRGWRTSSIKGTHLSIHTETDLVFDCVLALLK